MALFTCKICSKIEGLFKRYIGVSYVTVIFLLLVSSFLTIELVGVWGTERMKLYFNDIVYNHAESVQHIEMIRTNLAKMRYAEKDILLNVGDPQKVEKYATLWQDNYKAALSCASTILNLPISDNKETCNKVSEVIDISVYAYGFNNTLKGIREGNITSTKQANESIQPYKQSIILADERAVVLSNKFIEQFHVETKDALRKSILVQWLLVALSGIGFLFAVILTAVLIRCVNKEELPNEKPIQRM